MSDFCRNVFNLSHFWGLTGAAGKQTGVLFKDGVSCLMLVAEFLCKSSKKHRAVSFRFFLLLRLTRWPSPWRLQQLTPPHFPRVCSQINWVIEKQHYSNNKCQRQHCRSHRSSLSLRLLHTLLERAQARAPASLSSSHKCTHRSDLSQHHYCVPLLSGGRVFFVFFFYFKYTLVALILRYTVEANPPPKEVKRRVNIQGDAHVQRCRCIFMRSG